MGISLCSCFIYVTDIDILGSNILALLSGGHALAQSVEALSYKPVVSLEFFIHKILPAAL